MGHAVVDDIFTPSDHQRYRQQVRRCLDALAQMLAEHRFSFPRQQMGMELELNLVDEDLAPAMASTAVLKMIDDPLFTTELGQHNLEINVRPRPLSGDQSLQLETELGQLLRSADQKAYEVGTALVMIGMLPTLREEHFDRQWLAPVHRYAVLNDRIVAARGERLLLDMVGSPLPGGEREQLRCHTGSILAEAACTSLQLHLQVAPEHFAAHWNAAQCLAGVQIALGANSPFLLGKALWHETRVPLFQQVTDTRPEELRNQGVRPRVWFGERWITSIFDLFEENVRYFPGLLAEISDEDPLAALAAGRAPQLAELRLHNGTVWRWNRPVYDILDGVPHLRVENRVLPAGPTVIDLLANAAFYYGAQRALSQQDRPVWMDMSFSAAERNFYTGAQHGMSAPLFWPELGWLPPDELVLRLLLPLAHEGLRGYGISDAARERYLGVIEQRCRTRQTGASWQRDTVHLLESAGMGRAEALREMLRRYITLMRSGNPVHRWPIE